MVWFGLALLVLLSVLAVSTFMQVRDTVVPLTKDLSREVLIARSSEIARLVDGYSAEIKTMSQRPLIREGDFIEIIRDITSRHEQINSDYEMIFYADRKGDFITSNNLRGNIGDRDYFQAITNGEEEHFITNPMVSRSTGELIFVVAWCVYDKNGEIIGLIASTVLLETLSEIAAAISIGESGFGYIVDQNGLLIAHPNEELRMSLNFLESDHLGYEGLETIGREMVVGNSGVYSYTRPNGERLVTAFNPIAHTPGWSLGVTVYEEELMGPANDLMNHLILLMIVVIMAVMLIVYFISERIAGPIVALKEGVQTVSAGNLDFALTVKTGDEIEELANAYNRMTTDLKEHIRDLKETTAIKERIESELQVANKIQSSMLPRTFPPYPDIANLELYAMMEPAREVGGDFYDFFPMDDKRRFCFCIGDVSGKGIPAALFMVITRTILKNQVLQGSALDEVFYRANNLLCSDNVEDMFVTVFMGIIDTKTGELEYVNAGHNPPMLARNGEQYAFLDVKRNLVLGGMEEFPFQAQRILFAPGDMLFIYTDGLNEAMNSRGEQLGDERMFAAANKTRGLPAAAVVESMQTAVASFVEDTPASDDLTMLVLTLNR